MVLKLRPSSSVTASGRNVINTPEYDHQSAGFGLYPVQLQIATSCSGTWPGGVPLPERITGPTSNAIDATRVMWEFFRRHART
jgi:poly(3-hydroxybutyrate) depolymerase